MNMDSAMDCIKEYINQYILECNNKEISSLCEYLHHGKMLRSKLLLAISGINEKALRICAFIEMIQSASLLHDDVIDNATIRRGKDSINAIFGNKNAIMLGDVLYSKAFYELNFFDKQIAQSISSAVVRLSIGEIEDVRMSSSFHTDRQSYINMCADKTAALIVAASECGAILRGLDKDKYKIYGENLGIAFQIIDDILDVTQDSKNLGKPSMSDFREGKSTLVYMDLYECLPQEEKQKLLSYFGTDLTQDEENWIKAQIKHYNIIHKSMTQAQFYANKALQSIAYEDNAKLNDIVKQMLERTF